MMQRTTLLLILCTVIFAAAGQLFMKSGAQHLAGLERLDFVLAAVRNIHVLLGLATWTVSTLCWIYVLRTAPLSRAYGLNSLTYVLVFTSSVLLFGEQVRRVHVAGATLIVIGIACLLSGN
jgi:drug/metabolite transporter (DMT)-like permease